jgi:fermentation-respiration switch protein FrsA (DUF1100 family)
MISNPYLKDADYRDIFFRTTDGLKLHGWFLKSKEESKGTILFLHGNAENISTHVNNVLWLVKNGFDVLIFDYRGYGESEGRPTLKGVHIDAEAALDTLFNLPYTKKNRVIVFGQSLGGAIAVYTVANSSHKDSVNALIIDSAFYGYRLIAREKLADLILTRLFKYPLSFLVSDYYSPVKWIKSVSPVPVLIIHGDNDKIVPVHHSTMIFNEASAPKDIWILKGKGHIEAVWDKDVRERLLDYLLRLKPTLSSLQSPS